MPPLVSILIPVYNARQWVGAAIDSALAQTWPNTEVIVLDDGSTDGSLDVVQAYAGRVRIHTQANGGQNVSRNRLTELSRGEWLVYLDADDELSPDAVLEKLACADGADAVYGSMELRHYQGQSLVQAQPIPAVDHADVFAAAFLWKYPNTSSFMFRRSAVAEVGGWNEAIRSCTDYDLYFRLLLGGRPLRPAPKSISIYRQWSGGQASAENAFRQTTTRLAVMWRTALELDRMGRWTAEAKSAFGNAALRVIRIVHVLDAQRAGVEFDRLRVWNPDLRLAPSEFPSGYRAAFRVLGFRRAEWLASLVRRVHQAAILLV